MGTEKENKAKILRHIRCQYQPLADRIRISGELENTEQESFWLTRRMLSQMMPHIVAYIEKQAGERMGRLLEDVRASIVKAQSEQSTFRWLEPTGAQGENKRSNRSPEANAADDSACWVVIKVNLSTTAAGCRLRFTGERNEEARLTLRAPALCRWLVVLHSHCQHAHWAIEEWPSWMKSLTVAQEPDSNMVLH